MALAKRMAMVVVFIPPAVDPGEPPISIKIIAIVLPGSDICEKSAVLNPAVLVVMDSNKETVILCGKE